MAEWAAFERLNGPFNDRRVDILFAQLMAHMSNLQRKRGRRPYRIQDFLITWSGPRQQSTEELMSIAKQLTESMGGEVRSKVKKGNAPAPKVTEKKPSTRELVKEVRKQRSRKRR